MDRGHGDTKEGGTRREGRGGQRSRKQLHSWQLPHSAGEYSEQPEYAWADDRMDTLQSAHTRE
jgi:hypothetical protein